MDITVENLLSSNSSIIQAWYVELCVKIVYLTITQRGRVVYQRTVNEGVA